MVLREISLFLAGVLVSAVVFTFVIHKHDQKRFQNSQHALAKVRKQQRYLNRCLKIQSSLKFQKLELNSNPKIAIYFPAEACTGCIDHVLRFIYYLNMMNKSVILVANKAGLDYVESLNNRYQYHYEAVVDSSLPDLYGKDGILALKLVNHSVVSVLQYSPGNPNLFKKYFSNLFM